MGCVWCDGGVGRGGGVEISRVGTDHLVPPGFGRITKRSFPLRMTLQGREALTPRHWGAGVKICPQGLSDCMLE